MLVLGFDTATAACSAALCKDGETLASRHEPMAQGHAEHLMGILNDVMAGAGKDFDDLDLLAVTTGPGSFTGLRIGLAMARGLALAAGLPCVGVTTLEAVAAGISPAEQGGAPVLAAIESKRADIYIQAFGPGREPLGAPQAVLPGALKAALADLSITDGRIVVVGDAAARAADGLAGGGLDVELSSAPDMPDAGIVAALAASRWSPSKPASQPSPLYIRPPDATIPKNGGRLRP